MFTLNIGKTLAIVARNEVRSTDWAGDNEGSESLLELISPRHVPQSESRMSTHMLSRLILQARTLRRGNDSAGSVITTGISHSMILDSLILYLCSRIVGFHVVVVACA